MTFVEYSEYIQSPEWKIKEKEFIEKIGKCQKCGTTEILSVHHKNYQSLGDETLSDICVLCWPCHMKYGHSGEKKRPLPRPFKERMEIWEKDCKWREVSKTLNFGKRLEPELPVLKEVEKKLDENKIRAIPIRKEIIPIEKPALVEEIHYERQSSKAEVQVNLLTKNTNLFKKVIIYLKKKMKIVFN